MLNELTLGGDFSPVFTSPDSNAMAGENEKAAVIRRNDRVIIFIFLFFFIISKSVQLDTAINIYAGNVGDRISDSQPQK